MSGVSNDANGRLRLGGPSPELTDAFEDRPRLLRVAFAKNPNLPQLRHLVDQRSPPARLVLPGELPQHAEVVGRREWIQSRAQETA